MCPIRPVLRPKKRDELNLCLYNREILSGILMKFYVSYYNCNKLFPFLYSLFFYIRQT